jgi:general secretion pathway protein B
MSFILDALKKSESDRQRQSGPALFEVKVAPPKSRFPVWAIAIVALLAVNMIVVGWMLLRRSSHGEDTNTANTSPAATSATGAAAGTAAAPPVTSSNTPAAAAPSAGAATASTAPPLNSTPYNGAPPNSAPLNSASPGSPQQGYPQSGSMSAGSGSPPSGPAATAPTPSQGQSWPASNQQGVGTAQARMPSRDQNEPTLARNATPPGNAREAGGTNADSGASPDDYAPAAEPGSLMFKGHVRRGTESGLVLYQDAALVAGANLPQLRLDLHVYAAKPQDRFALINMHKMHEGDSIQNGVRVEAITPDGVVMSHNGSKFLLPRD